MRIPRKITRNIMMLGLLAAINSAFTLGLANTIGTFGGVVLNMNVVA
ncbi:hypothetical protein Rhow_008332 [Rhodococcus wratislaviensis]|uniref:Uncharacterized protein n=2 Tax=Rhodococcus TaxID=1827 RepID=A0A402CK90_RHOWR|nr:hypothetical protein Rhow_008332 [Rhodococcus wratislaviensis]